LTEEYCTELLLGRRSIRRFKPEDVSDEILYRVIEIARYAPSARNSQPWEFIVVRDAELKEKLAGIHAGAKPLRQAPLAVVVVCDPRKSPVSYMLDCANAATYFLLAAHALGLGTLWIQALRNTDEIRELLKIPEGRVPVAIIAVGWPDESPEPRPRRELKEITHLNRYGEPYIK